MDVACKAFHQESLEDNLDSEDSGTDADEGVSPKEVKYCIFRVFIIYKILLPKYLWLFIKDENLHYSSSSSKGMKTGKLIMKRNESVINRLD